MATLYRPAARNEHGDPVDGDGNVTRNGTAVGDIDGIVFGGPRWRPINDRGDIVDTSGMVGIPVTAQHQPRHGDTLVIDATPYAVKGPPQWQTRGLVATPPRYHWWTVTARSN